ncbi:MAG: TIGR02452 family protein [Bacteroidota bacterium]
MKRKAIAADTLKIIKQGYFINPDGETISVKKEQTYAENNTRLYTPEGSDQLIKELQVRPYGGGKTAIIVNRETTMDAARQLIYAGARHVLCLNFASAKNPGGGFLGGAQAQEESIARATGLYPCLLRARTYYEVHRKMKSCMYTDHMIYSPAVPIFKDENGANLHRLDCTAVITSPAVNAGVVLQREPENIARIEPTMRRRIEKVLAIALANDHRIIVLGAWGCGVFRNNPDDMARYFRGVIDAKFDNAFEKIVFAIYARNDRFVTPFIREFG